MLFNNNNNNKKKLAKQLASAGCLFLAVMYTNMSEHAHTHACSDTYKCPCSKCCSSHDIQETPQLPTFCPGEDHPRASYDSILLVAFSFSDNKPTPPPLTVNPHLQSARLKTQLIICINTLKCVHLHTL